SMILFPTRVGLIVSPGNAHIKAGTSFSIDARLVGNRAPIVARVELEAGDRASTAEMATAGDGFHLTLSAVSASFTYRVVASAVKSSKYVVTVSRAPRVDRIDVDYAYPAALGLKPRTEDDSGDIYAPEGTDVRLHIHADRPVKVGSLKLGDGK